MTRKLLAALVLATAWIVVANTSPSHAQVAGLPNQPIVGMTTTPSGHGYWLVARDGGVFSYGTAAFHGSMGGKHLNQPIVGMAASHSGQGYWLVARDGGIFSFGDAGFHGSMGGRHLNQPIVGMAASHSGKGYWLVARDGGIFSFGDAGFHGSMGGRRLNKPIVGMAPTRSGQGYWMAASDGGVFTFGDAHYFGSAVGATLFQPIVGMGATRTGNGYLLAGANGAVFSFGDAGHFGSAGVVNAGEYVATAAAPGGAYWVVSEHGNVVGRGAPSYGGAFRDTRTIVRTYTYSVRTRGSVSDVRVLESHAAFTLNDPRGWSRQGTRFVEVPSGGNFTIVLTQASLVPSFGPPCSSLWSCTIPPNVVINNDRWVFASSSWVAGGGSLRDYRHMVINHEVGHWLGHGHLFCRGPGQLAPVMQQQSISLQGCRFNPWPLDYEL